MKKIQLNSNVLHAVLGEYKPAQLSARLFMDKNELLTPEKYLIWFHERFHYLQTIFTPYGHLKWDAYRTMVADCHEAWVQLPKVMGCNHRIPIAEYLSGEQKETVKIAATIWMRYSAFQIYTIVERGVVPYQCKGIFEGFNDDVIGPEVIISGEAHRLRGIDILESFAKFEEAILGECMTDCSIDEYIDPDKLNKEYYCALYYFIEQLGGEYLFIFPVVCELALMGTHIPGPRPDERYYDNAPGWRFAKIVEKLKLDPGMMKINPIDPENYNRFCNEVLERCGFDKLDAIWENIEEYYRNIDLTMAKEMQAAIEYKRLHPCVLAYPMADFEQFISEEFNRFEPLFTITNDGVMYNVRNVLPEELLLENHLHALVTQIYGQVPRNSVDTYRLMCGFNYAGTSGCRHYKSGECDGYIDKNCVLPPLKIDEHGNIKSGCTLELLLNRDNTTIKEIQLGNIRPLGIEELRAAAVSYKS